MSRAVEAMINQQELGRHWKMRNSSKGRSFRTVRRGVGRSEGGRNEKLGIFV